MTADQRHGSRLPNSSLCCHWWWAGRGGGAPELNNISHNPFIITPQSNLLLETSQSFFGCTEGIEGVYRWPIITFISTKPPAQGSKTRLGRSLSGISRRNPGKGSKSAQRRCTGAPGATFISANQGSIKPPSVREQQKPLKLTRLQHKPPSASPKISDEKRESSHRVHA